MVPVRAQRLRELISKAMHHARSSFDLHAIVKDCYEDDMDMFGQDDAGVKGLLSSMLDQVHEEVIEGMDDAMKQKQVLEVLNKVDTIVGDLEHEDMVEATKESNEQKAAEEAVRQASLPQNAKSPEDVVRHAAYQKLLSEKQRLESEIACESERVDVLKEKHRSVLLQVDNNITRLDLLAKELEKSADLCSGVS